MSPGRLAPGLRSPGSAPMAHSVATVHSSFFTLLDQSRKPDSKGEFVSIYSAVKIGGRGI